MLQDGAALGKAAPRREDMPTETKTWQILDLLLELQDQSVPKTMMIVVTHSQGLARRLQRCYELDLGQLK